MKRDDIHHVHPGDLRHEGIVRQPRIEHTAVSPALDGGGGHRRIHPRRHEQRDEDGSGGSRRPRRTGQRHIDQERPQDDPGNEERAHLGDHIGHGVDEMLVAPCDPHRHGKAHAGADRLNESLIRHALGKRLQGVHRRTPDAGH